jgi:hypothetical protein
MSEISTGASGQRVNKLGSFQSKFLEMDEKQSRYDGTQLRSLYAYLEHGLLGDSMVAWIGPCDVSFQHMVDGEDLRDASAIRGSQMLHFIVEKFEARLPEMVALQRLMSAIAKDLLETSRKTKGSLRRDGDDLYWKSDSSATEEGKLSISIATVSPVSGLIHFAINVANQGTPVKTASLEDLGLEPKAFAKALLAKLVSEFDSISSATRKVKWVN